MEIKIENIIKEGVHYLVSLSNKENILVNEDDLLKHKINKDIKISKDLYNYLINRQQYNYCYKRALKLINYKAYSKTQIYHKLLKDKYNINDINEIITYLEDKKLIDDEVFYVDYVNMKKRLYYGPLYIKNKLYQLGIDKEVRFTKKEEYVCIKHHINKMLSKHNNLINYRKKILAYLIKQGFTKEYINDLLDNVED